MDEKEENNIPLQEEKRSLQRAGTMDITALEGIELLHKEGLSIETTADHLRSGQVFKNVQEPDSSEIVEKELSDKNGIEEEGESALDDGPVLLDEADHVDAKNESKAENKTPIIISSKETNEPAKQTTTLTITDTIQESKEILGDETLGKTRGSNACEPIEEEPGKDDNEKEAKEESRVAATPDSKKPKIKTTRNKTPVMMATVEAARHILGRKSLGRTRSQDRKRSLKVSNDSPKTTQRRSTDGTPVSKRKKR